MRFPKFWGRGECEGVVAWRSSDFSQSVAEQEAKDAAQSIFHRLKMGPIPHGPKDRYGYGVGPLREEVIEEIPSSDSKTKTVLTRNAYGSLIINTENIMFIDIDVVPEKTSSGGFLSALFGKKETTPPNHDPFLQNIKNFVAKNNNSAFRVYQTKGGYRLLCTSQLHDPTSSETQNTFAALNADPLYRKLCERQQSFRARVSPKPWRCGLSLPPCRWPIVGFGKISDQEMQKRYQRWLEGYQSQAIRYASCKYLTSIGIDETHPEVQAVVTLHDKLCQASTDLSLA